MVVISTLDAGASIEFPVDMFEADENVLGLSVFLRDKVGMTEEDAESLSEDFAGEWANGPLSHCFQCPQGEMHGSCDAVIGPSVRVLKTGGYTLWASFVNDG